MVNLEEIDRINTLMEYYGCLLTNKQLTYLTLYYEENLSLSEIGDEFQVSRNAIHDTIKKSIALLEKYEQKLNLITKNETKLLKLNNLVLTYPELSPYKQLIEELMEV